MHPVNKIEFCKQLNIIEVCRDIAGINYVGKNQKSPFRNDSGGNAFSIDKRRNMFADWGYPVDNNPRGFASGDPIDFVSYYYGCSTKEAIDILWKFYKGSSDAPERKRPVYTAPQRHEAPTISKEQLNLAYSVFLSMAPLERKAAQYLKTVRHMSDEEIAYYAFKSFPPTSVRANLTDALRSFDIDPDSIPGLFTKKGDRFVSFRRRDAVLLPIRTVFGNIEGLQMRFFETKEGGPRYIWFSSDKMDTSTCLHDGKSPGTPIGFVDRVVKNDRNLFITEGLFKAIAINKCYGCPTFTVQGVGNYAGIDEHVAAAISRYPNINRILIAYDADFIGNISVTSHAIKLYHLLKNKYPTKKILYVLWNEKHGKGFDDLIESTGGWNVQHIVKTIPMQDYEAAYESVMPRCKKLMFDGKKEEIKKLMVSALAAYLN